VLGTHSSPDGVTKNLDTYVGVTWVCGLTPPRGLPLGAFLRPPASSVPTPWCTKTHRENCCLNSLGFAFSLWRLWMTRNGARRAGVYLAGPDGLPVFRAPGRLKTDEVADVVQITKARALRALERRGVVRVSPGALEVDVGFAARDPVLAQLAAAVVAGLPPAGPAERKREPVVLAAGSGPEIVGDLVVQDCGFKLHTKASSACCATKTSGRSPTHDRSARPAQEVAPQPPATGRSLPCRRESQDGLHAFRQNLPCRLPLAPGAPLVHDRRTRPPDPPWCPALGLRSITDCPPVSRSMSLRGRTRAA
jgi:hypothetical protein